MRSFQRWIAGCVLIVLCTVFTGTASAQGGVGFDITDSTLTAEQRAAIIRAHQLAAQQVRVALQYLQVNATQILAGQDEFFNQTFGRFYDRTSRNPLLGQYNIDIPAAELSVFPIGFGNVNQAMIQFPQMPPTPYNGLELLDQVLIPRVRLFNSTEFDAPNGEVFDVFSFTFQITRQFTGNQQTFVPGIKSFRATPQGNQQQGGGGGGGNNQFSGPQLLNIGMDRPFLSTLLPNDRNLFDRMEVPIHQVVGETMLPDREYYLRVLRTFEAIRDLLDVDTIYTAEPALVEQAMGTVFGPPGTRTLSTGGTLYIGPDGRVYSRAFRQFGLSNSDSALAEAARAAGNPILWVDDNDVLDGMPFYNQKLTAFFGGQLAFLDPQDPLRLFNRMFVGGAFLREMELPGGLFDFDVADGEVPTALSQFQMIIAAFAEHTANLGFLRSPNANSQFFPDDVAAFGVGDIFGELGAPFGTLFDPFPGNFDAGAFGRFAGLMGDPRFGTGIGDGSLLPPPGKNAVATPNNFFPVVPFQ